MNAAIRKKVIKLSRITKNKFSNNELTWIKNHHYYNEDLTLTNNIFNILNNIYKPVECKSCKTILKFRDFKRGYGDFCSRKCSNAFNVETIKQTNIDRYGKSSYLATSQCKDYTKSLNLKKYGVENYQSSNDFKSKVKETWKSKDITDELNHRKHNNKLKYGCDFYFQSDDFKKKQEVTNILRYGTSNPMQSKNVQEKSKLNRLRKFIERVETENNVKLLDGDYTGVALYKKYKWKCLTCNNEFLCDISLGKRPICPVCYPKTGTDIEVKIEKLLSDIGVPYIKRSRQIISPQELDFYIPSKNIAIEVNGLVWHSEFFSGKTKNYHLNKHKQCKERGIKLIMLYEDDINDGNKFSIITSRLNNLLEPINNIRIGGNKCKIREVTGKQARKFLIENHIAGYSPSNINIGLYYMDKLVHICTFIKANRRIFIGNKELNEKLELVRSCSLKNHTIHGGVSKVVKHCYKKYSLPILTYSDLDWGTNTSYIKAGFKFVKNTSPGYWIVKNNKRYHRFNFTKNKLKKHLEKYDDNLTVIENCRINGMDRLWNTGNECFVYTG